MNPLLPAHIHVPDAEARVWKDGRLYLYGSYDLPGDDFYCSDEYYVFSTDDLVHWQEYPQSFSSKLAHFPDDQRLFAPDCICKDGKYYLLYCGMGNTEGIAVSDTPEGPFGNAYPLPGADGDAIDPCGLVDDDGQVYYFWGQFNLRGALMTPDLKGLDMSTFQESLLNEKDHGFHEGSSIRKRNGLYYMIYCDTSRGKASCYGYAVSEHPLGPYEKKGIIIDNDGCDPDTWNNHGSIEEFNGQWYVFYHRSSRGTRYSRRMCAEPITFNEDGTINEVEMTTQGTEGPIPADKPMEAWRACLLSGNVRTSDNLDQAVNGDWAAYKYLSFNKEMKRFSARVRGTGSGNIEIRLDASDGELVCTCPVPEGDAWQFVSIPLEKPVDDIHSLFLVFRSSEKSHFDILDFSFS